MSRPLSVILRVHEHSRDSEGMRYVYPVVSRRARGVSVGINLNPNNACNWRCIYCQVPDLQRGGPPPIDLDRMAGELDSLLRDIRTGDFLDRRVADAGMRRLVDVAFSGNGEPTSAAEFPDAVDAATAVLRAHDLLGHLPLRLITNGSLLDRPKVQHGISRLASASGEVWFKFDAVGGTRRQRINGTRTPLEAVERRLSCCARLCPTWLQSCFFLFDGKEPDPGEIDAYVDWVTGHREALRGVHLYGLARASTQPEAPHLGRVDETWLEALASRLRQGGLTVSVSP